MPEGEEKEQETPFSKALGQLWFLFHPSHSLHENQCLWHTGPPGMLGNATEPRAPTEETDFGEQLAVIIAREGRSGRGGGQDLG